MQKVSTLRSAPLLVLLHHLLSAPPVALTLTPRMARWRLPSLGWRWHLGKRSPAFNLLLPPWILLGVVGLAGGGGGRVPWLCSRPCWPHLMWPGQLLIWVCILVVVVVILVIIFLSVLFQLKDLGHRSTSTLLQAWPTSSGPPLRLKAKVLKAVPGEAVPCPSYSACLAKGHLSGGPPCQVLQLPLNNTTIKTITRACSLFSDHWSPDLDHAQIEVSHLELLPHFPLGVERNRKQETGSFQELLDLVPASFSPSINHHFSTPELLSIIWILNLRKWNRPTERWNLVTTSEKCSFFLNPF